MVLPGLHDSHTHPVTSGAQLADCMVNGLATVARVAAAIGECVRARRGGTRADGAAEWFRGTGWETPVFPGASPGRRLLDSLVPDRPAYMESADGHSAWVNTRALAAAGISAETPDPPGGGGRIERDRTGAPSGTLRESAIALVTSRMPSRTAAEYSDGLRRAVAMANAVGLTGLYEADADSDVLAAYRGLDQHGALTVDVVAALHVDPAGGVGQIARLAAMRSAYRSAHLRPDGAKIFADGVLESHTAALLAPYADRPGDRGTPNLEGGAFDTLVTALDRAGFQVHVHAIGDRAVRLALDAMAAARRANGVRDSRHQIAHLQLIDSADVPRFRALGVYANVQPLWAVRDSLYTIGLDEPALGPRRSARIYPIGEVARTGATVVAGSDWNVSSMNPFEAIQVAVTRRDVDAPPGPAWEPSELVTLPAILAAYTLDGARAAFADSVRGSVQVGKWADLVVLDRNLFRIVPTEIHGTRVLLTVFEGREVYRDSTWVRGDRGAVSRPAGAQ